MNEPVNETIRSEFLPLSILRALWKRKLVIAMSWLAICATGAAVVYTLPAVYESRTVILIERQRIPERYVASTVNEDLSNRLNRINQQILSYEPLLRLIEEFNLYTDDVDDLAQEEIVQNMRDDIKVGLVEGWTERGSPAFQISYEGEDPNVVAQIANRLATLFIDENLRTRANQAIGTTEFLTNQLEEARQELERQEALLRDYRLKNNGELPQQENVLLSQLQRLERELQGAEEEANRNHQTRIMLESSLESARASMASLEQMAQQEERAAMAGASVGSGMLPATGGGRLTELQSAEIQLQEFRARYSEAHPDIRRMEGVVARLRTRTQGAEEAGRQVAAALEEEAAVAGEFETASILPMSSLRRSLVSERERIAKIESQITALHERTAELARRQSSALAAIGDAQARVTRLPIHEQELSSVVRDYDISMRNYQSLLDKRIEADLASEMETRQKAEKFSVLEPARLPEVPVRPNRPLAMGAVAVVGTALAAFLGFIVELRQNVLLGDWELPGDVMVLGQVPFILTQAEDGSRSPGESRPTRGLIFRFQRRAVIASSVLLASVVTIVATSVYLGWISF